MTVLKELIAAVMPIFNKQKELLKQNINEQTRTIVV